MTRQTAQNPRPEIIPGFRRILHGGDYNPDQWLRTPEVIDEDFRLMKLAGCNTFAVGIFSWTSYEAEEGSYRFDWLDRVMAGMAEAGHKVMLATPSGSRPAWMSKKYPEIRRVQRDGQREVHKDRHNHCWTSPVYRAKVKSINEALATRYGGHAALGMWHISNEYAGECYCEGCLQKFYGWLEARYGTLGELNHAWWAEFWSHTFTAWDEIDPRDWSLDGLQLDWLRFNTQQVIDFFEWEAEPLRRLTPGVPCTTNFMGLFPTLDYARLAEHVDIVADDQYPAYDERGTDSIEKAISVAFKHDLYRCFKPDRPSMLMESCPDAPQWKLPMRLKPENVHRAEMLQAIGHGAEGTCYFQWRKGRGGVEKHHGAVVDHAGHENTRVFRSVAALGRSYEKLSEVIGSVVEAEVALIYDWDVRWAFERSGGMLSRDDAYSRVCFDHYQPFWELGVSVDVLASGRDFSAYRLLIAPQLHLLKPGVAARLREFVERGGTLVSTYYTGFVGPSTLCFTGGMPGDGLVELFGVWNEETDCLPPHVSQTLLCVADRGLPLAERYPTGDVCAIVEARGAQVLATYGEGFYAGTPALTVREHGRGRAYYQAARMGQGFLGDFYRGLAATLGIAPALPDLPAGVTVQRRRAEHKEYFFLQNFGPTPQTVKLGGQGLSEFFGATPAPAALELASFESAVFSRG